MVKYKKICFNIFVFLIIFIPIIKVNANDKINVKLLKCIDGDTARFDIDGNNKKVRFLAINTKESTNKVEKYGKEASEFTCNKLKEASKIELEYDNGSDKTDKYGRELAWIWVDNELLQNLLIKEGLAEVKYIYGNYKYTDILKKSEIIAKEKNLNIWNENNNSNLYIYIFIVIIIILLYIFNISFRKKTNKKIKRKLKKDFDKKINKLLK